MVVLYASDADDVIARAAIKLALGKHHADCSIIYCLDFEVFESFLLSRRNNFFAINGCRIYFSKALNSRFHASIIISRQVRRIGDTLVLEHDKYDTRRGL